MPLIDLLAKLGGLVCLGIFVTIGVIVIEIGRGFEKLGRAAEEDAF